MAGPGEGMQPPARWRSLPRPEPEAAPAGRSLGGTLLRVAPLLALAAFGAWRGHVGRAVVLVGIAVLLTVAGLVAPGAMARVDAGIARVATGISHAIAWLATVVIEVVVVLPGRLATWVRRREPVTGRRRGMPATTWRVREDEAVRVDRPFGSAVPGRGRARGWIVAVLLLLVVGEVLKLETVTALPGGPVVRARPGVESLPDLPMLDGDALEASPAMADVAWRHDYADEMDGLTYDGRPYLVVQTRDRHGRYLNVVDHHRVSYRPATEDDLPVVWFLGGSTTFGLGQRDDHTIPSEVARLAESEGRPVRVVNLGQPGATAYQDALLLEQELAVSPAPDLVVAYEGANDLLVQSSYPMAQPTAFPTTVDVGTLDGDRRSPLGHWADSSLLAQLLPGHPGHEAKLGGRDEPVFPPRPPAEPPAEVAAKALGVYERSLGLARRTAERHGVPIRFVLQPARFADRSDVAARFRAGLPDEVLDLSGALDDHPGVYLDHVQVDEEGAAVVAAALWDELRGDPALTTKGS